MNGLVAWVARLLNWQLGWLRCHRMDVSRYDLCWPTSRLLLLAARERRDKSQLPSHCLGRLPAEVLLFTWLRL